MRVTRGKKNAVKTDRARTVHRVKESGRVPLADNRRQQSESGESRAIWWRRSWRRERTAARRPKEVRKISLPLLPPSFAPLSSFFCLAQFAIPKTNASFSLSGVRFSFPAARASCRSRQNSQKSTDRPSCQVFFCIYLLRIIIIIIVFTSSGVLCLYTSCPM